MPQNIVQSTLLNTPLAADYLKLSCSMLEKLRVYGGGPPYLKLGRSVRYRREDLCHWLDERVCLNASGPNPAVNARRQNP